MEPEPHSVTLQIAGTTCTFETGRIARLCSAAVVGRCGDNVVLATVVAADAPRPGADFFPLTVEYREKMAAAGRIPGAYGRRETRITDHEVLVSRLIDRTIRSLFPEEYRCEVQIQVAVLSADPQSDLTSLAILAACAALHVSPVPFHGPAAGIRLVSWRGSLLPFPSRRQRSEAELDFVVGAGPQGLVMVEGEAREAGEDACVQTLSEASTILQRCGRAFEELRSACGRPKSATAPAALPALPESLTADLDRALSTVAKNERRAAVRAVRDAWLATLAEPERPGGAAAFAEAEHRLVRQRVLDQGRRLDGRGLEDIRPIWCDVGWLPRAHGSAVFTRGETQALVTATLGTTEDALQIEDLNGSRQEHFFLHYGFPPYSVNEIRPLRGPGRREIGHGFLARRGLARVLPEFAEFPYTIRIESEIAESNGSSSMATVCGATLALWNAGVPLRKPVAGIAMGLITDGERTAILSDILGDEDHLGDMDFKVVGTEEGVTALQLDNKVGGLGADTLRLALDQARRGRLHILGEMKKALAGPAPEMSRHAPRVQRLAIVPEAIGILVGPRGANIKAIQSSTGARVSVEDDGTVLVYAADGPSAKNALAAVRRAAGVVRRNGYYRGEVTGVKEFGIFVKINAVTEGLVPAEEIGERGAAGPEGLGEGAAVVVKVLGVDDRGRLRLSRKAALGVDEARIEF
ncbi:MAG: polyribonucleotide nucleotidyltransferase [Planctomycetes bacterium]|nr:polyribonucleotide nucleotidyltransferase [Planctomycetota bacterium]